MYLVRMKMVMEMMMVMMIMMTKKIVMRKRKSHLTYLSKTKFSRTNQVTWKMTRRERETIQQAWMMMMEMMKRMLKMSMIVMMMLRLMKMKMKKTSWPKPPGYTRAVVKLIRLEKISMINDR